MSVLIDKFDVFAGGFWLTLQICLLAAIGALILGAVVAVMRISPVPPLRAVGTAYVTVFRNMPLTVVMFFAAFGLPALGSNADFLRIPVLDAALHPARHRSAVLPLRAHRAGALHRRVRLRGAALRRQRGVRRARPRRPGRSA